MEEKVEYGIICNRADEKKIVKNLNIYLQNEYSYRKMYKWKYTANSKLKYEYGYCQFMKQCPRWHFDLYPNEDLNGKWKYENKSFQFILFTIKHSVENYTAEQRDFVDLFFKKLIEAIGFETVLLHEYKEGEERAGNYTHEEFLNLHQQQAKENIHTKI